MLERRPIFTRRYDHVAFEVFKFAIFFGAVGLISLIVAMVYR
jgi:hypothetical protein